MYQVGVSQFRTDRKDFKFHSFELLRVKKIYEVKIKFYFFKRDCFMCSV